MKRLLLIFSFVMLFVYTSNSQAVDTVFTMAKTSVFTTNIFSSIAVGKNNTIWAGTSLQGLYKYNGETWEKATVLTNHSINNIKVGKLGSIWVGQSGSSGAQAVGGGIYYFPSGTSFNNPVIYNVTNDAKLPTRNVRSLYVDTSRFPNGTANGIYLPTLPIWAAHMADITGGVSKTGAVSRGLKLETPIFQTIKTGVETANGLGSIQTIGGSTDEVWAFASNNFGNSQILRYKYINGSYLGFYDYTNVNPNVLAQTFLARAIYFDSKGRKWIGLNTGEVVVNENGKWYKFDLPSPTTGFVNNNAITGDKSGNVYIGRTDGLYMYSGGNVNDQASYRRYGVLDGLPSNNIRSITIDEKQRIWLATDAGIARMSAPFTVYNLIHPGANAVVKGLIGKQLETLSLSEANTLGLKLLESDNKHKIAEAVEKDKDIFGYPISINVAADSSTSTLIFYKGANAANKEINLTIGNVSIVFNGSYRRDMGQFKELIRRNDTLLYLYKHPCYVDGGDERKFYEYGFTLRDKTNFEALYEGTFNVYHAPVMFVHGVWSSILAMKKMEDYFANNSGNYFRYQLLSWWYKDPKHIEPKVSSRYYQNKIPEGIDELLKQCRQNNLSAGKVNVVGHSRGGLFTRAYAQSNYVEYRNDVNALITVNSPNWGSQGGNVVLDNRVILNYPFGTYKVGDLLSNFMLEKLSTNPQIEDPNGAFELRVNSDWIKELNDKNFTDRSKVPAHAITSTYEFGLSRADILKSVIVGGGTRVPVVGNLLLGTRLALLMMGSGCAEGPIDNCLKEMFNGETNDIVVPISSQKGGLTGKYVTDMGNKMGHSVKKIGLAGFSVVDVPSVLEVESTQKKISELLRQDPNEQSSNFVIGGFKAPASALQYTFLPNFGNPEGRATNIKDNLLTINPAIKGLNYTVGQSVPVAVTGSNTITTILVEYRSASLRDAASDVEPAASYTFNYPIPKEAVGKVFIIAYGFNAGGLVAVDSSFINVGIPASATLDSIKFERNGNSFFEVPAKDSITFNLLGYFSDTVRNITGLPQIQYEYAVGGIATLNDPNNIKGEIPGGIDLLSATYLNKSDTVEVQVIDSVEYNKNGLVLPTHLLSFTASTKNRQSLLVWKTATEVNAAKYEIEYSRNAVNFFSIGSLAARGPNMHYSFTHTQPQSGKNFYRLKMIDKDGHFEYSPVRMILMSSNIAISLHPNPVTNNMTFELSAEKKDDYQLQILNIEGKLLQTLKIKNTDSYKQTINVSSLPKGFYLLKVVGKTDQSLIKFEKM